VRIEHLDGTGTQTIIEVQPSIDGLKDFIRTTPGPIPKRGEVIVPPTATPAGTETPTPRPRRY
jgi:hypothetical protein